MPWWGYSSNPTSGEGQEQQEETVTGHDWSSKFRLEPGSGRTSSDMGEKGERTVAGTGGGGGATLRSSIKRKIVSGGALTYTFEDEQIVVSGGGGSSHTGSKSTVSITDRSGKRAEYEFRAD
eukprot:641165-Pelagomonas_calceolata.AAC.1